MAALLFLRESNTKTAEVDGKHVPMVYVDPNSPSVPRDVNPWAVTTVAVDDMALRRPTSVWFTFSHFVACIRSEPG